MRIYWRTYRNTLLTSLLILEDKSEYSSGGIEVNCQDEQI